MDKLPEKLSDAARPVPLYPAHMAGVPLRFGLSPSYAARGLLPASVVVVLVYLYDDEDRAAMIKAELIVLAAVSLLMVVTLYVTHIINKRTLQAR